MSASGPFGNVPQTNAYAPPSIAYVPAPLPQRRPFWKTILVGMLVAYSPLAILVAVGTLVLGTSSPNRIIASLASGASLFGIIILIFAYLTSWQIALIYIERRDDTSRYSFWRAVGSALLLYFAVLLPILAIGVIVFGIALQSSR